MTRREKNVVRAAKEIEELIIMIKYNLGSHPSIVQCNNIRTLLEMMSKESTKIKRAMWRGKKDNIVFLGLDKYNKQYIKKMVGK